MSVLLAGRHFNVVDIQHVQSDHPTWYPSSLKCILHDIYDDRFSQLYGSRVPIQILYTHIYTVKPVYKGHSREPENVAFMNSLKFHVQLINGKNETILYRE